MLVQVRAQSIEIELIHVRVRTDEVSTGAQLFTFFPPARWIQRAANNTRMGSETR